MEGRIQMDSRGLMWTCACVRTAQVEVDMLCHFALSLERKKVLGQMQWAVGVAIAAF